MRYVNKRFGYILGIDCFGYLGWFGEIIYEKSSRKGNIVIFKIFLLFRILFNYEIILYEVREKNW